jgi:hypothetical protein
MAERPDQIERHIESTRNELGNNLQELQHKVKQAADWKTYYERNPMMMVGLAFGGGVLLSGFLGGKTGSPGQRDRIRSERGPDRSQVNQMLETLKGALIGVTATKLRTVLDQVIPGFNEQYQKIERAGASYNLGQSETFGREFERASHKM